MRMRACEHVMACLCGMAQVLKQEKSFVEFFPLLHLFLGSRNETLGIGTNGQQHLCP